VTTFEAERRASRESEQLKEKLWPLDLALTALAGVVLYLIITQLRFDDPRWLFNGWTYAVAVPIVALVMDVILRRIASRYVQRSIQFGMLFSLFVHLLLLILAVNVVIFSKFFPEAFTGAKLERSPIRKTVPEYLFQAPQNTASVPDWSEPVHADTTSPVIPQEERRIPPVVRSESTLELPRPKELEPKVLNDSLVPRKEAENSKPLPADSPAKMAKRSFSSSEQLSIEQSAPLAPAVTIDPNPQSDLANVERSDSITRRQDVAPALSTPLSVDATISSSSMASGASRSTSTSLPRIGDPVATAERPSRSSSRSTPRPAGAAPAVPTVAIAQDAASELLLQPMALPNVRMNESSSASIALSNLAGDMGSALKVAPLDVPLDARGDEAASPGVPSIQAGSEVRASSKIARDTNNGSGAVGDRPNIDDLTGATVGSTASESPSGTLVEGRIAEMDRTIREMQRSGLSASPALDQGIVGASPLLDFLAPESVAGLADRPNTNVGVAPSPERPEIAALDISRTDKTRRDVGGPATPAGSKIAAVESFSRRVKRTSGGAAPSPAGMVGPATEEAIELGLGYLSRIQNKDGSWSLQGHGDEVLLQSDTAATGLCLLAFQGAGYTHRQHQYAATVARGLQFLIENQRTNGDLYRTENDISDRNVAFYSHGIAALAVCEAYGMTQDLDLREPAQRCVDFIVETQHSKRGGWRYEPQVSSDTSVTGWMMMAIKSGELSGLNVPKETYEGIDRWLDLAKQGPGQEDRYRYNPYAPDTPTQRHGRMVTPTMTAVGMLMRMYSGWRRDHWAMKSAAEYLLKYPPQLGTARSPQRDAYYWYYSTQVMFHMGGDYWDRWNRFLNPMLIENQIKRGPESGSWDPELPVPDRWSPHGGRIYVTTMNLLNLEVYYRHLPIYEDTAQ
jgi:hypothetical protein